MIDKNNEIELDVLDLSHLDEPSKTAKAKKTLHGLGVDPKKIIQLILSKIKRNDSFLTFSKQIGEVNKILQMKYSSANDIAHVLLKDVPLTSKLLKLVNSSFYGQFSTSGISTISEAMIIVGTDQIKFMAASLKLIEFMQNLDDSDILKEKTLKGLQRSIVAGQIVKEGGYSGSEILQVSSVLYDFGEYLVTAFAPKIYRQIKDYKDQHQTTLDEAAKAIIGISYSDLGILIADKWNLPNMITNSMKPVSNYNVKKSDLSSEGFLQFINAFANDICDIDLEDDRQAAEKELKKIRDLYARFFDIPTSKVIGILKFSKEKIAEHASLLNITPKTPKAKPEKCIQNKKTIEDGIKTIKQKLETEFIIQEIFENVLKYIHDGFKFSNISFCIKNKQKNTMKARYVLGEKKKIFLKDFNFKIIKSSDVFNKALHNESTIVVDNIETSPYRTQIPLWFKESNFSTAFAILPVGFDNKILSMLYMDWKPEKIEVCEETISYLEIFKDLIIDALKKKR